MQFDKAEVAGAGPAGSTTGTTATVTATALFNLIPVWQLDGGRGFNALSRLQRGVCAGLPLALYLALGDGLVLLLAAGDAFAPSRPPLRRATRAPPCSTAGWPSPCASSSSP